MSDQFEKILKTDTQREDEILLPLMQDPRIGQAILFELVPELGQSLDVETIIKEIAEEQGIDEDLVREAYERGKNKFERIQERGY